MAISHTSACFIRQTTTIKKHLASNAHTGMGDYKTPEERMEEARRAQEEREVEYEQVCTYVGPCACVYG